VLRVTEACTIHGMCHITGGGLLNFRRLSSYGFSITDPLEVPAIFRWLQETGGISDLEMYRTFNMGMGYASSPRPGAWLPSGRLSRAPGWSAR